MAFSFICESLGPEHIEQGESGASAHHQCDNHYDVHGTISVLVAVESAATCIEQHLYQLELDSAIYMHYRPSHGIA